MKADVLSLSGQKEGSVELPPIFETPVRLDLIQKAYVCLDTHHYQPKGTHPTAGMDVVARSNDPPTGHGSARIARMRGGGGGRQGQAGGVASVRGGRQAHPPKAQKVIRKNLNKKENRFALCSAVAATASGSLVAARGHKVGGIDSFPVIVSDDIENIEKAKDLSGVLESLKLADDVKRLESRKARSGKSRLRGRQHKAGKSVLFVTKSSKKLAKACGGFAGVEAKNAGDISVLDLAPGADVIRLAVYSKSAIEEIAKKESRHLEIMAVVQ